MLGTQDLLHLTFAFVGASHQKRVGPATKIWRTLSSVYDFHSLVRDRLIGTVNVPGLRYAVQL